MGMTSGRDTCQLQNLPPVTQIQWPVPKPGTCPAGWNTTSKSPSLLSNGHDGQAPRPGHGHQQASLRAVRGQTDESRERSPLPIRHPILHPSTAMRTLVASAAALLSQSQTRPRQPSGSPPRHLGSQFPMGNAQWPRGAQVNGIISAPCFLFGTPVKKMPSLLCLCAGTAKS